MPAHKTLSRWQLCGNVLAGGLGMKGLWTGENNGLYYEEPTDTIQYRHCANRTLGAYSTTLP